MTIVVDSKGTDNIKFTADSGLVPTVGTRFPRSSSNEKILHKNIIFQQGF